MRRLRAAAPELPVVVITGLADRELARQALGHGAQDFLVKGEAGPELLARALVHGVERARAARAGRERESYFRSLLHNLHEDILVVDPDHRIRDVNNTVLKTLGLHRDQVGGAAATR
jgi:FixJ family two-component response regulator